MHESGNFIIDRLGQWSASAPDQPSYIYEDQSLTYEQLDSLTSGYARFLRIELDAHDDNPIVPIVAARNLETVIWMLSCIKAQVPFLNINSGFPVEHIAKVIDEIEAPLCMVTDPQLMGDLSPHVNADLVNAKEPVQLENGSWMGVSSESSCRVDPEDVLYAVSTSGTTGKPKISRIPHRAFKNYSDFVIGKHKLKAGSRALSHLAPNFDVFLKETLIPLQAGMTVRLLSEPEKFDGETFARLINDEGTHWLNTTYTFFRTLEPITETSNIEHLIFVGEALGSLSAKTLAQTRNIWNEYGPAECTVGITLQQVRPGEPVSIGRAIDNNEVLIVDQEEDRELSPGQDGELLLVGRSVGLGYMGDNAGDQYAHRNVVREDGSVLTAYSYRTGDLAYKLDDGRIMFRGRRDTRVKVRGQWVDLNELEKVIGGLLEAQAGVKVFYHRIVGDQPSLVAYVSRDGRSSSSESATVELRSELERQLNRYEVPEYIIEVDHLPFGMNDKLDQNALVATAQDFLRGNDQEVSGFEVDTPIAADLKARWVRLLGHDRFERGERFFDAGGNSLLFYQLFIELADLGFDDLTVRVLAENDSFEQMTHLLEGLSVAVHGDAVREST